MIFDRLLALVRTAGHLSRQDSRHSLDEIALNFDVVTGVGDAALSSVGRESEFLRRSHVEILADLRALASIEDEVAETFQRAESLFDELAEAKAEIARNQAVAQIERDASETAARRLSELSQLFERTRSELDGALSESLRLLIDLKRAEDEGRAFEEEKAALAELQARTEADLAAALESGRSGERDLATLRADLRASDLELARSRSELAREREGGEIAKERAAAVERQLDEARTHIVRLTGDLAAEKDAFSASRQRQRALEGELLAALDQLTKLRIESQAEITAGFGRIAALTAQLTHGEAVEAVRERRLQDMQAEHAELEDRRTAAERGARESELAARHAEDLRQSAHASRVKAETALADAKASQKRMLRRVSPLIAALRGRTQEARARATLIAQLESRLEARSAELNDAAQLAAARAAMLTAELETERSRRLLAEGGLNDDRARRVASLADGLETEFTGNSRGKGLTLMGIPRPDRRRAKVKPTAAGHAA